MLLLSLPQPVKITSAGLQPSACATAARLRRSSSSLSSPGPYSELGLAKCSPITRRISSATSSATRVVAALSR